MKLWGGRFEGSIDDTLEEFGASIHFDQVLWREDILGSLTHVKGLLKAKVLTEEEAQKICEGLETIERKIAGGNVTFKVEDEDIHMNIERLLFQQLGELAGKVHTGRSRNDQVALDMRLYMRHQIIGLIENCFELQQQLLMQSHQSLDIIFPGYTHMQRAQPIRLAHHWMAYVWMVGRDIARLKQNFVSTNILPLGAGAMAGSSFPISQEWVADKLHFDAIYQNSLDAVSDRDYLVECLSSCSIIMMHLSKLCEELILWSTEEFSFIELDDAFCTGSSMMPQKKNPDAAELIRGKTGRVYGSLMSMLTILKSLPLAYNKDLQEDKEGLFDSIKTVNGCLMMMSKMISTLKIKENKIKSSLDSGFLNATEIANYLVKKGMAFRPAHEIVGQIVKHCVQTDTSLSALSLPFLQNFSTLFSEDVKELFILENVVEQQSNICGTARNSVLNQIKVAEQSTKDVKNWLDMVRAKLAIK